MTSINTEVAENLSISHEKSKTFTNENEKLEKITTVEFTTEALIDALFLNLAGVKQTVTNSENNRQITVRKYYRQARELSKWIPISATDSPFVIYLSDLSPKIKGELNDLEITTVRYILKEAAGQLFENLDFQYYHLSIARNLKVRLER